jgi:hypothetical protein
MAVLLAFRTAATYVWRSTEPFSFLLDFLFFWSAELSAHLTYAVLVLHGIKFENAR